MEIEHTLTDKLEYYGQSLREAINSAHSFYSYVSDGGTRHVKRRRRHDDGTYSDSESCDEDDEVQQILKEKRDKLEAQNRMRYGKKKRKESRDEERIRPAWLPDEFVATQEMKYEEQLRSFSVLSEVSEGGTRRRFKRKVLRDDDGNIIGYGTPEPYMSPGLSDEESIRLRRGSIGSDEDDEQERAKNKRDLKRLQKMIERPMRRGQQLKKEGDKDKPWIEEALEGFPLKKRTSQKNTTQEDKNIDLQLPDMPTAGIRSHRNSTLDGINADNYFSDSSDDDDVDLSAMTEEERKEYMEKKEKRRQEREQRMRAKFGDKYDEMKRKKKQQKESEAKARAEAAAEAEAELLAAAAAAEEEKGRQPSASTGDNSNQQKLKQKPKSMVSYEKGPARNVGGTYEKTDGRDIGPSHLDWRRKSRSKDLPKKTRDDGSLFDYKPPKMIPVKLSLGNDKEDKSMDKGKEHHFRFTDTPDSDLEDEEKDKAPEDKDGSDDLGVFEIGEDGNIRVKDGETIDLSRISSAQLRKLGIDPKLSKEEIVKRLKEKLGTKIKITDGLFALGTKPISAYDLTHVTDEMLAGDPELDVNTLKGPRRVNILMRKGGEVLRNHVKRIMEDSDLVPEPLPFATNLDEKDASIDFLSHYRLVDPERLEGYARAFAVEDRDLDTAITFLETQTALDGVNSIQYMTSKQMHYVLKVLDIDDASQVTFRMFAVITALCERVTLMDPLSKHLLDICNLADIERKLDLYKAMFYHNVKADRRSNFITAESLKIELIAGGLSWNQQKYVMEKMEANSWGEISFLDYMCYIPLFMSMHDNICDNPLDMSDQKYTMPPRQRPPSPQRDMNPLGVPLNKFSSFLMKKQARDLKEGKIDPATLKKEHVKILEKYAELPDIDTFDKPKDDEEDDKLDMIY